MAGLEHVGGRRSEVLQLHAAKEIQNPVAKAARFEGRPAPKVPREVQGRRSPADLADSDRAAEASNLGGRLKTAIQAVLQDWDGATRLGPLIKDAVHNTLRESGIDVGRVDEHIDSVLEDQALGKGLRPELLGELLDQLPRGATIDLQA